MKNLFYFLLLLVTLACQNEDVIRTEDVLKALKVDKNETIEFTLLNDTVLVGKKGTKIFVNKNLFKNYTNGLIKLELIEYYDFSDFALNSLETITNDSKLLESSGVLFINFTEDGKQLNLSDKISYKVQIPRQIESKNEVYYNDNDTVFNWELSEDKIYKIVPDRLKNLRYGLTVGRDGLGGYFKKIHIDSVAIETSKDSLYLETMTKGSRNNLDYLLYEDLLIYEENVDSLIKALKTLRNNEDLIYEFNATRLGYINIDQILEYDKQEIITIIDRTKSFKNLNISYIYINNNSFYNNYWESSNLNFKEDIKISGKIKVVVFTTKDNLIYSDSFYVDSKSKTTFELDLKKTTIEKLKKEMTR